MTLTNSKRLELWASNYVIKYADINVEVYLCACTCMGNVLARLAIAYM